MKAPEKIYLEKIYPDNGILPNGLNYNQSPNDIEYIRTDAFIEKACEWLKDNIYHHVYECGDRLGFPTAKFIEDFKNYMK